MKHKVKFELYIPERSLLESKLISMHCLQNYYSLDSHQMNSNKGIMCISTKKQINKQTNETTVFVFCFSTTWILAEFFIAWFWNNSQKPASLQWTNNLTEELKNWIDITIIIKYNCHFTSDTESIMHKIIFNFFWTWVQWISFHYNRVFYKSFFIFWESVCSHECVVRKTKFVGLPLPFNGNIYFSCVELALPFV